MKKIVLYILLLCSIGAKAQNLDLLIDDFYTKSISPKGMVNYSQIDKSELNRIVSSIEKVTGHEKDSDALNAYYINSYNILIINSVMEKYPSITSVDMDPTFFSKKYTVNGLTMNLNELEQKILSSLNSGETHFVLNCGAVSCPPLYNKSFKSDQLRSQIDKVVAIALSSDKIIDVENNRVSKIFDWYKSDFTPDVSSWIEERIGYKLDVIQYMKYDWSLNDVNQKTADISNKTKPKYFASKLYNKGKYEVNMFNNYYSQTDKESSKSDFFTSTWSYLYGINSKLNIGLDVRIRSTVKGNKSAVSSFNALNFRGSQRDTDENGEIIKSTRAGISAIGLKVKYQISSWSPNLTFQHVLYIPTASADFTGFFDWDSPYLLNDVYFDRELNDKSSIFVDVGFYIENMNSALFRSGDGYYQISTPLTLIYSYFPTKKSTVYALGNMVPKWGVNVSQGGDEASVAWDPFWQVGVGFKYFLTDKLQAEVLYTKFYSNTEDRTASTYNFGVRYYGW